MMDVNSFYRKYEKILKEFNSKKNRFKSQRTKEERNFAAVNDAILLIFICYNDKISFIDGLNNPKGIIKLKKDCENLYNTKLFFSTYNITNEVVNIFQTVYKNLFTNIDSNDLFLFDSLFGKVLEKHINQKETGSYYTPKDTSNYIINISLKNNMFVLISKFNIKFQYKIENDIMEIIDQLHAIVQFNVFERIMNEFFKLDYIDPTCGSGAFIIGLYDTLSLLLRKINDKFSLNIQNDILSHLYGVDISKEAIYFVKMRLIMKIILTKNMSYPIDISFFDNFIVGDALNLKKFPIRKYFDCIIGNPPYVEAKKNQYSNFESYKCGNLYAYTIESSLQFAKTNSVISFIVPLSFITTKRMLLIKNKLETNSMKIYYSTFADRPGCLFTGVHQRLAIFSAIINKGCTDKVDKYTTKHHFWYNEERNKLFLDISYVKNDFKESLKIGNLNDLKIAKKLKNIGNDLKDHVSKNSELNYKLYISTRIGFWGKAFLEKPLSNEYKVVCFVNEIDRDCVLAFFNSSTFYYYWVLSSDCWHVIKEDIFNKAPINLKKLGKTSKNKLSVLAKLLMEDLEKNKVYVGTKQVEYEYKHKLSKDIIDQIDEVILECYGFNEQEKMYIKTYTEKYR